MLIITTNNVDHRLDNIKGHISFPASDRLSINIRCSVAIAAVMLWKNYSLCTDCQLTVLSEASHIRVRKFSVAQVSVQVTSMTLLWSPHDLYQRTYHSCTRVAKKSLFSLDWNIWCSLSVTGIVQYDINATSTSLTYQHTKVAKIKTNDGHFRTLAIWIRKQKLTRWTLKKRTLIQSYVLFSDVYRSANGVETTATYHNFNYSQLWLVHRRRKTVHKKDVREQKIENSKPGNLKRTLPRP